MKVPTSVAARELCIHPRTLAIWAREGRIRSEFSAGGRRLFSITEIERLKAHNDRRRDR